MIDYGLYNYKLKLLFMGHYHSNTNVTRTISMCFYLLLYGILLKTLSMIVLLSCHYLTSTPVIRQKLACRKIFIVVTTKTTINSHLLYRFLDTKWIYKHILHIVTHVLVVKILKKKPNCYYNFYFIHSSQNY